MKVNEIKETKEVVVRTTYIAEDGTEFRSKEECEKYEQSALCVLNSQVKRIGKSYLDYFLGTGGDYEVEVYRLENESDVEILKRYLYLEMTSNGNSDSEAKLCLKGFQDIKPNTDVIVEWSYDGDYAYTYGDGTIDAWLEQIRINYNKIIKVEE